LNDRVRTEQERKTRADAFEKRLLANLPPNHPARVAAEEKERSAQEARAGRRDKRQP